MGADGVVGDDGAGANVAFGEETAPGYGRGRYGHLCVVHALGGMSACLVPTRLARLGAPVACRTRHLCVCVVGGLSKKMVSLQSTKMAEPSEPLSEILQKSPSRR